MSENESKPLVWLKGEVKTPPFSSKARLEIGFLLRKLQGGKTLSMPISRPMPTIGSNCHELRINDEKKTWRIVYFIDDEAIVILDIFEKTSNKTPKKVIELCQKRLRQYQYI